MTRRNALERDMLPTCREPGSRARSSSRTTIRDALLRVVALAASLFLPACSESSTGEHFVVLLYHHVAEDTPRVTSVTPAEFESHLDYLGDNGFTVWPLTRAVSALESGEDIPDRTVAITFDDAYSDIAANAAPMLEERDWPYTVFVATKAVDEGLGGIMDWEVLRGLTERGATLANHGHSHDHLIRRRQGETEDDWLDRVRDDIETGARRLREETDTGNDLFAWPYGEYNLALEALAEDLGLVAFSQASGAAGPGYGRQRLPRFPVAGDYADLDSLKNRFDALPLPVSDVEPAEPQRAPDERRPALSFRLGEGNFDAGALSCFVSGQGPVEPGRDDDVVRMRAERPLPPGRSRYNCTAPSKDGERFYWYSHPWFIPNPDGSWPEE